MQWKAVLQVQRSLMLKLLWKNSVDGSKEMEVYVSG